MDGAQQYNLQKRYSTLTNLCVEVPSAHSLPLFAALPHRPLAFIAISLDVMDINDTGRKHAKPSSSSTSVSETPATTVARFPLFFAVVASGIIVAVAALFVAALGLVAAAASLTLLHCWLSWLLQLGMKALAGFSGLALHLD